MTYELACWLAAKLDIFDLKVRGGKTKKGRENNDLYYSSGWAHGYKQAQTDARRASRGPRLPKAEPPFLFPSKCCKCGKVDLFPEPQKGVYFCSYACT